MKRYKNESSIYNTEILELNIRIFKWACERTNDSIHTMYVGSWAHFASWLDEIIAYALHARVWSLQPVSTMPMQIPLILMLLPFHRQSIANIRKNQLFSEKYLQ